MLVLKRFLKILQSQAKIFDAALETKLSWLDMCMGKAPPLRETRLRPTARPSRCVAAVDCDGQKFLFSECDEGLRETFLQTHERECDAKT